MRRLLVLVFVVCGAAGCGSGERVVSVSGKVLLDDQPMPLGTVTFAPDKDKGNTTTESGVGAIKSDGTYSLGSKGRVGIPPGWYKVGVSAAGMPSVMPEPGKPMPAPPKINPKFVNPETSGIRVEVVSAPGPDAYTIKLTK